MLSERSLFIQNNWIEGESSTLIHKSPLTSKISWQGKIASLKQIIFAVHSAHQAQEKWTNQTFDDRVNVLKRYQQQIEKNREWLASIIHEEVGKPLWECEAEVGAISKKIDLTIKAYKERCQDQNTDSQYVKYLPLGTVAVIGPFNFPMHIPQGQIMPALLAGNTVVFKPSEKAIKSAQALVHLWDQSDPPKGIWNMVSGGAEQSQYLMLQDHIKGIYFTGSEKVGRSIARFFSKDLSKLIALELGGNNPIIINKIENQKVAIQHILMSAYVSAGQRCTCARRLIMVETTKNRSLLKELIKDIKKIRVGPTVNNGLLGPVISLEQRANLLRKQSELIQKGAKILVEMKSITEDTPYVSPALIDVTTLTDLDDDENFGPLLQLKWVSSIEEAFFEANKTRFGLSAAILSDQKHDFLQAQKILKVGILNWNSPCTGASSLAPFGGQKASGNYRPAGFHMIDSCVQVQAKTRHSNLNEISQFNQWIEAEK